VWKEHFHDQKGAILAQEKSGCHRNRLHLYFFSNGGRTAKKLATDKDNMPEGYGGIK